MARSNVSPIPANPGFRWISASRYRSDAVGLLRQIREFVAAIKTGLIAQGVLTEQESGLRPKLDVQVIDARTKQIAIRLPDVDWRF